MQRYLLWGGVALALALAAYESAPYFAAQQSVEAGPGAIAGHAVAVFALRDDRGRPVSLERYRGSIVVMNLWASWCPPCRAEMPDLQRLAQAYRERGVVVVGVNEGESPQRARAFAAALGIRFPIWIDAAERYGRVYAALGLPTTVVIDRYGTAIRGFDGALTFEQMRALANAALAAR